MDQSGVWEGSYRGMVKDHIFSDFLFVDISYIMNYLKQINLCSSFAVFTYFLIEIPPQHLLKNCKQFVE